MQEDAKFFLKFLKKYGHSVKNSRNIEYQNVVKDAFEENDIYIRDDDEIYNSDEEDLNNSKITTGGTSILIDITDVKDVKIESLKPETKTCYKCIKISEKCKCH